jgi:hypothetical protein
MMMRAFALWLFLAGAPLVAQSASEATIQALLSEVRQLRAVLEKSAILAPKIQMTLQRMQLQQTMLVNASRELESVRSQLAGVAMAQSNSTAQMRELEVSAPREHDVERRKMMEREVRMVKEHVEQRRMEEAQLRGRESEIAGKVQSEQAKLDEVAGRLNAFERLLDEPKRD